MTTPPRGYLSVEQTAVALGVTRKTVERMVGRGALRAHRQAAYFSGRGTLFKAADVRSLVKDRDRIK